MRLLYGLVILIFAFSYSCKKELAKDENGFSEDHPCFQISCENGECVDGSCVCENGFSGTNCTEILVPDSIFIHSIRIIGNREENNYAMWEGEDKFLNCIMRHDAITIFTGPSQLVTPQSSASWTIEPPIVVTNIFEGHTIKLYENQEEYLYGLSFGLFSDNNTEFPATIEAFQITGDIKFEFDLTYSWG